MFLALRQEKRVFSDLIAHVPLGYGKVPVRYGETPTEKQGEEVSGNYFAGLGVHILRGAGFTPDDETDHNLVVVLSYTFWTETFSRNPRVIGQTLFIKGVPFTIIGVTHAVEPGYSCPGAKNHLARESSDFAARCLRPRAQLASTGGNTRGTMFPDSKNVDFPEADFRVPILTARLIEVSTRCAKQRWD